MKRKVTTILAIILCAIITVTGIYADTAYAADKTPLKVTFKGKTVTLTEDVDVKPAAPKVKTLKNKWGNPKKEVYRDNIDGKTIEVARSYTWTKGETTIAYNIQKYREPMWTSARTYIRIDSSDKNLKVNGIKIGMKKSKAEKILKNLQTIDENGSPWFLDSDIRVTCSYDNKGKVNFITVDLENL